MDSCIDLAIINRVLGAANRVFEGLDGLDNKGAEMTEQQKTRILIVDDEPAPRETLADFLIEDGFSVEATATGKEALAVLKQSSFELVISDLRMPEMDGIELINNIKSQGFDMPIIVITAFGTIEDAVKSMKAGAYEFIIKPFNFGQIKMTIEKALETKRLQLLARERELYEKMSYSDELTELANYRFFQKALQKETERARRYKRPLSLMMLDIDNFKNCNDAYGHLAGDMALKQIASLIKKNTRGCDLVARYGGEEFTVLLPETSIEETQVVADRIRDSIETAEFKTDNGQAIRNLTITIGISSFPDKSFDQKGLIQTADLALYQGKVAGKNRVIVYNDAPR